MNTWERGTDRAVKWTAEVAKLSVEALGGSSHLKCISSRISGNAVFSGWV